MLLSAKSFGPKLCNDEDVSCSLTQVAAHACLRQKLQLPIHPQATPQDTEPNIALIPYASPYFNLNSSIFSSILSIAPLKTPKSQRAFF